MINISVSNSASHLRHFLNAWKEVTSNPTILEWVAGYHIPFVGTPTQRSYPSYLMSKLDEKKLDVLLPQLIEKGVVWECCPSPHQFLSSIFLEPKPDDGAKVILNLKKLNNFLAPPHFKLEDYRTAIHLLSPYCFLSTLDLKDAYYLIAVCLADRKFLQFRFREKLFKFTCFPFGLSTALYIFTKLLKPVVHSLRSEGLLSVIYLDDFLLMASTLSACVQNAAQRCEVLYKLGFLFSPKKCHFPPSHCCQYLSFMLHSASLQLELPPDRRIKVACLIRLFQRKRQCSIREYAQFLGSLGACCPAIPNVGYAL